MLVKILRILLDQCRTRGVFITMMMNGSHMVGILRGFLFKLLYYRNIKCSVYSMQSNSKIEVFNKRAKISIGKYVFIRKNASIRIDFNGVLNIEDKVFINDNCSINCVNKITIGEKTKIAPNVCINDHDHNYKGIGEEHLLKGEVIIGKNVWIGSNVVILRDTVIGDHAVIAAGSIVKGKVPANTLFMNKRENGLTPFYPSSKNKYSEDILKQVD